MKIVITRNYPYSFIAGWLDDHGVDPGDYSAEMAGIEFDDDGSVQFYPEYSFDDTVDEKVLTEFVLRFA